jgi:acetolactate synthase-1/2/3 large subunit
MSEPHPRVADRIARVLKQASITHAFGMPGGEVITLLDALEEAGVFFVLARNETAAAMMAAGCCASSDGPGLLVTTLGPGLANAVNGIADAWQERVPLIVISGVVERGIRARYTHQVVDHRALLAPLVKGSFEIEPLGAEATIARAVRLALAHPRGPVHLDLSPQVAADRTCPASAAFAPMRVAHPWPDAQDPALTEVRARRARAHEVCWLCASSAGSPHEHSTYFRTYKLGNAGTRIGNHLLSKNNITYDG